MLVLAPELYLPLRQLGAQFHASADGLAVAERMLELLEAPRRGRRAAGRCVAPSPARRAGALRARLVRLPGAAGPRARRARPRARARRDGRARRRERRGQEHGREPAPAPRRADRRAASRSAASTSPTCDAEAWRRQLAWVPQRPTIFRGTVADNIRLGDAARDRARACARRPMLAGADAFVARAARTATRRSSATAAGRSRPASGGGSRSRARSCATRRSSSSTSRPPTSTRRAPSVVAEAVERLRAGPHGAPDRAPARARARAPTASSSLDATARGRRPGERGGMTRRSRRLLALAGRAAGRASRSSVAARRADGRSSASA